MKQELEDLKKETEELKKEIEELKRLIQPEDLTPRVINKFIVTRSPKTDYISAGNTVACTVMLDIMWNRKMYRLPAFEV